MITMKVSIDELQETIKTDDESQQIFTEFKNNLKKQFLAIKLFLILIAFVSLFLVYYSYVVKKQRNELQVRIENCETK